MRAIKTIERIWFPETGGAEVKTFSISSPFEPFKIWATTSSLIGNPETKFIIRNMTPKKVG